jgi:hypothetical protein
MVLTDLITVITCPFAKLWEVMELESLDPNRFTRYEVERSVSSIGINIWINGFYA